MLKNIVLLLIILTLLLNGCASKVNFAHTPVKEKEFTRDMKSLQEEYSDINEYDRIFAGPQNAPTLKELTKKWGKPEVNTRWVEYGFGTSVLVACAIFINPLCLVGVALQPRPLETYVWEKGHYTINAVGVRGMLVKYEDRIYSWEWEDTRKMARSNN